MRHNPRIERTLNSVAIGYPRRFTPRRSLNRIVEAVRKPQVGLTELSVPGTVTPFQFEAGVMNPAPTRGFNLYAGCGVGTSIAIQGEPWEHAGNTC